MRQKRIGGRIANEILMYFRSQRKSAQDVSLSDMIETGTDGAPLELMDVVSQDSDLLEQVSSRELARQLRGVVDSCLTEQERQVIVLRYGLDGGTPRKQREVSAITGISRSYVSRRSYCKRSRCRKRLGTDGKPQIGTVFNKPAWDNEQNPITRFVQSVEYQFFPNLILNFPKS